MNISSGRRTIQLFLLFRVISKHPPPAKGQIIRPKVGGEGLRSLKLAFYVHSNINYNRIRL